MPTLPTTSEIDETPIVLELPPTECGIIMPISAIGTRTEKHWASVLQLLHRAISAAGLTPVNVWSGELTDRVSERIVGNIFAHEIVVADISELNPNVMFELGLRLASKKPTIVIGSAGGAIPFDIRDFHVIQYPGDLNILEMEEFFARLETSLRAKLKAYSEGTYEPFLGAVVVDVLTPEARAVPFNELILERIEDLSRQLSRPSSQAPAPARNRSNGTTSYRLGQSRSVAFFTIPAANEHRFAAEIMPNYRHLSQLSRDRENVYLAAESIPPRSPDSEIETAATALARQLGGHRGAPDRLTDAYP